MVAAARELPDSTESGKTNNEVKQQPSRITFSEHIAPILYNKCASCHHEGEAAPFPLMSFEDASKRAETINAVVTARYMPPWKPAADFGNFQASRALTAEQIRSIQQWVAQGAPEGDKSVCPPPPQFTSDWRLGKPDLILTMPLVYRVSASGPDVYRCFVIPTGITKDRYVSAVEFKPGNRKVVHHAIFYLDNTGVARKKDAADKEPGFASFGGPGFLPTGGLGGWAPGNSQQRLAEGVARVIRSGADLVIQEHFHPTGKEEEEKSTIGIYFAKTPPKRLLMPMVVRSRGIDIPANEKNYSVKASFDLPIDMKAINVTPHAHLLCREIKAVAHLPGGEAVPLIWIRNWDFNWQEQYTYDLPVKLPRGTRVDAEFIYDNTSGNPRNPNNPPKRVRWGEQTTDEMAILFFGVIAEDQEQVPTYVRALLRKNIGLMLKGNPGQLLYAARQILKPDRRFGRVLQESEEQTDSASGRSAVGHQHRQRQVSETALSPRLEADVRGTAGDARAQNTDARSTRSMPSVQSTPSAQSTRSTPHRQGVAVTTVAGESAAIPSSGKATVLLFLGVDCPISNRYSPEINALVKTYESRGIKFVGVYCDPAESAKSIAEHQAKFGCHFEAVHDTQRVLQKLCGATTTPEVAVLQTDGTLVYRGRIDNRYVTFGTMRSKATESDLEDVLKSLEAGHSIVPRVTKPVGCTISRN